MAAHTATQINAFFARYPAFPYDPTSPVMTEFNRLRTFSNWATGSRLEQRARRGLQDAMILQFNDFFGTDVNDIRSWHNLCQVLDIVPVPEGLTACKKVCSSKFRILQLD